jgi:tetratricopeptide (TPR) repeat protein
MEVIKRKWIIKILFIAIVFQICHSRQSHAAVLKTTPSSATCDSFANKAFKEFFFSRYSKALSYFDSALLYCPGGKDTLAQIYTYRAATEIKLHNYKNALNNCDTALKLDNTRGDSYLFKGAAEVYLDDYQSAISDESAASVLLNKALNDSDESDLSINLAMDFDADTADYTSFDTLNMYYTDSVNKYNVYDILYGLKYNSTNGEQGLLTIDTLYAKVATNELHIIAHGKPHGHDYTLANLRYYLGSYYGALGNPDSSAKYYAKAVCSDSSVNSGDSFYPCVGDFYSARACSYFDNNKFELAIEDYSKAIEIYRHKYNVTTSLYTAMAGCEAQLKQYDKAIKDCTTAIALDSDFDAYYARGCYYLLLNKKEEAKHDFRKVIAASQDDTAMSHPDGVETAFAYLYLGDTVQALLAFTNGQPLSNDLSYLFQVPDPEDFSYTSFSVEYYGLSCFLALINKPKQALHYLEIALAFGISKTEALSDPDLDNIKNTPGFKELMKEY